MFVFFFVIFPCIKRPAWVELERFLGEFVYLTVEICHWWTLLSATHRFSRWKIGKNIKDVVMLGLGRQILENSV